MKRGSASVEDALTLIQSTLRIGDTFTLDDVFRQFSDTHELGLACKRSSLSSRLRQRCIAKVKTPAYETPDRVSIWVRTSPEIEKAEQERKRAEEAAEREARKAERERVRQERAAENLEREQRKKKPAIALESADYVEIAIPEINVQIAGRAEQCAMVLKAWHNYVNYRRSFK